MDSSPAVQQQTTLTFRIVSAGKPLTGVSAHQAREALLAKFKLNDHQLDHLLNKPVVVKKGLSKPRAESYLKALRSAGLDARLLPEKGDNIPQKPVETSRKNPVAKIAEKSPQGGVRTQLEELFAEPIPRLPVGLMYRLGLVGVMVMSLIAPIIYLGLVLAAAGSLLWYLSLLPGLIAQTHSLLGTVFTIGFVPFICGVFLLFLARPLFIKYPPSRALALDRRKHRTLFHLVELLCKRMNLPPIKEIRLDNSVNASMGTSQGLASLLRRELTLTIGMPLVAGFSSRQLIGVIGHELGHFAQPTAMVSNYVVNNVNFWMANRAFEEDAWDKRLTTWRDHAPFLAISVMIGVTQGMIWLTRQLFKGLFYFNLWMTRHMSRQMEYDADRYECWLTGSDAFDTTARRLHTLGYAAQQVHQANARAWDDDQLMEDLPGAVAELSDRLSPEQLDSVFKQMEVRESSVWDTHPADNDRIRHAKAQSYTGVFRLEYPARDLLADFDRLCKVVTLRTYADYGIADARPYLTANNAVLAVSQARDAADEALGSYFNDNLTLRLMEIGRIESPDQGLQQVVDEIRGKLPELQQLHEAFFREIGTHSNRVYGRTILAAGVPIEAPGFALRSQDVRDADDLINDSFNELKRLRKKLQVVDTLFARRMQLAIQEMEEPQAMRCGKLLRSLQGLAKLPEPARLMSSYASTMEGLMNEEDETMRETLAPALEQAAARCREGIAQFLQVARQVPVSMAGKQYSLIEYTVERGIIDSVDADDLVRALVAPTSVLDVAQKCDNLVSYVSYRTLSELVKACEDQERALNIRPLRLTKVEVAPSSTAA